MIKFKLKKMKNYFKLLLIIVLIKTSVSAQNDLKQYKAGHVFNIGLPTYMTKTIGLNSSSSIEYENKIKDVFGFVIFDSKEELTMVNLNYSSINEFYEDFIKDFLKDEKKRKISKQISTKKGEINFIECDASYFDNDAKTEIYYLIGIVETKNSYYKVLSWCTLENKDKFKADFQKILYSLND